MAEILLFHHAQGRTDGMVAFADALRRAGHTVHVPDLYGGNTFASIDEGVNYARTVGFGTFGERGEQAAEGLPAELVYAGFSLGVMPAQSLVQSRPGAKGAILFSAAFPVEDFGTWPAGVPVQIHMMEDDEWVNQGDLDAAREIQRTIPGAELFLYDGDRHLFADSSLPDHDEEAARLALERVLAFLEDVDAG